MGELLMRLDALRESLLGACDEDMQTIIDARDKIATFDAVIKRMDANVAIAQEANRELTRQVEQMAAEAAVLQATITKLRGIADTVRWWTQESGDPRVFNSARRIVELIDEAALTAPPSSSDRGRNDSKGIEGDTGREER